VAQAREAANPQTELLLVLAQLKTLRETKEALGRLGCVLATRLSEDPDTSVTLLEAGPWDRNPWIHIPMGFARLYVTKKFDWNYQTEAEGELGGNRLAVAKAGAGQFHVRIILSTAGCSTI
jgi:hypothetical protein